MSEKVYFKKGSVTYKRLVLKEGNKDTLSKTEMWEASVGWDHPLVMRGIVPGHLIRETLGPTKGTWNNWVSEHRYMTVNFFGRAWFDLELFHQWFAKQIALDPKPEPARPIDKKAQPRHNRKGV